MFWLSSGPYSLVMNVLNMYAIFIVVMSESYHMLCSSSDMASADLLGDS